MLDQPTEFFFGLFLLSSLDDSGGNNSKEGIYQVSV